MTINDRRPPVSSLLPTVIVAILAILLIVWFNRPGPKLERERIEHGAILGSMTGLARPVNNTLSNEYRDANSDLIADCPADKSKQLDPPELRFSYIASDENARNAAIFAPLMEALRQATGKTVRFVPLTDPDEQLTAFHDGELHVCAFNTGAVPIAVDAAGFVPVSVIGGESGPQTYVLKLIASTRSGINDIKRINGEEITLTEMGSNSGFKAPLVLLQEKFGLMPGRDYAIRYSGGQQQSIDGLANDTYSVIAVASDILARAEAAGRISPNKYKVLYSSDPFPTACFGYAHDLSPELAKKIENVLAHYSFAGNSVGAFFGPSGQTRLVPTQYASDFRIVREIDNAIGYEHKLRRSSTAPSTQPATQPAE